MQVNIKHLIDEVQCYQTVREWRGPDGVVCPSGASTYVMRRGCDDPAPARQRSECHDGPKRCDALPDTSFAGPHQPLKVGVVWRYVRGRHVSHAPMAPAWSSKEREA